MICLCVIKKRKMVYSNQSVDYNLISMWLFYSSHTQLESTLKDLQQNHKDKKQDLQTLDEEIRSIQPSTSEEGVLE